MAGPGVGPRPGEAGVPRAGGGAGQGDGGGQGRGGGEDGEEQAEHAQRAAARAPQIKSGWKAMFSVFTAAAPPLWPARSAQPEEVSPALPLRRTVRPLASARN